jgi:2-dehydropantoate 2-reductase
MTLTPSIAVVGPGAIGGTVAAWLSRSVGEERLTLCARTPLEVLRVQTPKGLIEARPAVITDRGQTRPVDWVLVATKTYDARATALWLANLVGPATRVAVLQNGVEHVARFSPWVPAGRIVPVVVEIPAERSAPGRITQRRDGWLKAPAGANGEAFVSLFANTDLAASTEPDWISIAWRKLAMNCAGAVSALTDKPAGIVSRPHVADLMRGLVSECLAVGRAEGATLPDDLAEQIVEQTRAGPVDSVNSLLADRRAGRPMEWDARNGVIARRGQAHGIDAPLNAMAATLLSAME